MSIAEEVRILALHGVLTDTDDYRYRYVQRWYSKTFHTPLRLVQDIPISEILLHFWECKYEGMDTEDLEEERVLVTEAPEVRKARIHREQEEKLANETFIRELEELSKKNPKKIEDMNLTEPEAVRTKMSLPEPEIGSKKIEIVPPDVKISFNQGFFDELMESDTSGVPGPDNKENQ